MLFFIGLLMMGSSSAWLSCATISCSQLAENACTQMGTDENIVMSTGACNDGYTCTFDDVMTWYTTDPTTRTNILACTQREDANLGENWACPNRQASKNLVSGTYPKECLSVTDCALKDGTTNECVCTPRSGSRSGYCKPDRSSSYFDEYWDLCTLGSNNIKDTYTGYYWFLKAQYAVYYDVTDLPACSSTLWEFQQLLLAQDEMENFGSQLAIAMAVVLGY